MSRVFFLTGVLLTVPASGWAGQDAGHTGHQPLHGHSHVGAVSSPASPNTNDGHAHHNQTPAVTAQHAQHQIESEAVDLTHGSHQSTSEPDAMLHSHEQNESGAGAMLHNHQQQEMQHDQSMHDHAASNGQAADMAMDQQDAAQEAMPLRDPHAYSGGYELASGLYALETESMMMLADQTVFAGLWMDRFEYVTRDELDVTELEGHAWLGGSYNRLLLRTEAEIENDEIKEAEIDLMGSLAVSPFWNLQLGFRHQIVDDKHRHWAIIGFNGLAPYWFEVDASLFVSEHGQTFYDLEAEYEILLTQRLVLQPRIDIHSYGKADEELGRGSGLSTLKLGARLRYEFNRQFAPYIGWERVSRFGETADLSPEGFNRSQNWWIMGVKFWF